MFNVERQFVNQLIENRCGTNTFSIVKYFKAWKDSLENDRSPVDERKPWMTFQSIDMLDRELTSESVIFEYGSGGSTLYFLDKGAKVITVEHDKTWIDLLKHKIQDDGLNHNWIGLHKMPIDSDRISKDSNVADPDCYTSNAKKYRRFDFKPYASAIDDYQDCLFDLVSVDGRSRPSCIKHSAKKVKIGGWLLLDNSERKYYLNQKTLIYLEGFEIILDEYCPAPGVHNFTKTTIWKRIV